MHHEECVVLFLRRLKGLEKEEEEELKQAQLRITNLTEKMDEAAKAKAEPVRTCAFTWYTVLKSSFAEKIGPLPLSGARVEFFNSVSGI
jgi:hypothetical protein